MLSRGEVNEDLCVRCGRFESGERDIETGKVLSRYGRVADHDNAGLCFRSCDLILEGDGVATKPGSTLHHGGAFPFVSKTDCGKCSRCASANDTNISFDDALLSLAIGGIEARAAAKTGDTRKPRLGPYPDAPPSASCQEGRHNASGGLNAPLSSIEIDESGKPAATAP